MWKNRRPPGVVVSMPWDSAFRPMPPLLKALDDLLEVPHRSTKPVELSHHQRVTGTQVLQRVVECRPLGEHT